MKEDSYSYSYSFIFNLFPPSPSVKDRIRSCRFAREEDIRLDSIGTRFSSPRDNNIHNLLPDSFPTIPEPAEEEQLLFHTPSEARSKEDSSADARRGAKRVTTPPAELVGKNPRLVRFAETVREIRSDADELLESMKRSAFMPVVVAAAAGEAAVDKTGFHLLDILDEIKASFAAAGAGGETCTCEDDDDLLKTAMKMGMRFRHTG
ncbi:hypothetical protein M569_01205 [Genlisea aurea]|uniref:Uncharacterized protein n=1 Tax=Genlisea aurea TaxID=192259 RepID=S8EC80_9LAMI|nr:hypothetical protein M569_01205 [Genlisea aurea]